MPLFCKQKAESRLGLLVVAKDRAGLTREGGGLWGRKGKESGLLNHRPAGTSRGLQSARHGARGRAPGASCSSRKLVSA